MKGSTVALLCCLDDFAKLVEEWEHHQLIPSDRQRRRAGKLSLGEMLSIMVLFYVSAYKDFKHFWLYGLSPMEAVTTANQPSFISARSSSMRLHSGWTQHLHGEPHVGNR